MRKRHTLRTLLCSLLVTFAGCTDFENTEVNNAIIHVASPEMLNVEPTPGLFPEDDGSTDISNREISQQIYTILRHVPATTGASMDAIEITEEELADVAEEVAYITEGKTTDKQKFDAIFSWIRGHVRYDNDGENQKQTAYYTFNKGIANCQGYSNLMNVMTHCAGLRSFNVNGYVDMGGGSYAGHAWNYVFCDKTWYVVDVTNNRYWGVSSFNTYKDKLIPFKIDVPLFEDDYFVYGWDDRTFAIIDVKQTPVSQLTIPFGIGGIRLSTFNPQNTLPESVKELYLGTNIKSIGESYNMGLTIRNSNNLKAIHVDPQNETLCSHKGILYRKNADALQLYYVPLGATYVQFHPDLKTMEKNTLYHHQKAETLVIPEGITQIEPYAVEDCPNLRTIYVAEDTKFLDGNGKQYDNPINTSFVGIHKQCQIIRGAVPTGIKKITM